MLTMFSRRIKDYIDYWGLALLILIFLGCENPSPKKQVSLPKEPSFSLPATGSQEDSLISRLTYKSANSSYGFGLLKAKDSVYYRLFLLNGKNPSELISKKIKTGKVLEVDSFALNDTTYIFLLYLPPGKHPDNSIYFALLNPKNGFIYPIRYHYTQDYFNLSVKYQAADSLKKHPLILEELTKRAAKYGLAGEVAKFGDPNLKRDSLMKRWVMLNDRVYDEATRKGESFQLNTEEVAGDLAPSLKEYENNDSLFKKNVSITENGQFRISALKGGAIYGFSKPQKKTFLLWVPDEPEHFIKSVQIKGNKVFFYDSLLTPKSKLKPLYEFNLGQKLIKKIK